MKTLNIALCGKLRSGKDMVADYLTDHHDFCQFAFSEGIWEVGELLFPRSFRDYSHKPRRLLQEIGQKMRMVDPDVWIRYTMNRINRPGYTRNVITDLRQPNELRVLREHGFFIIRVNAPDELRLKRARANGDNFTMDDLNHETEKHVDSFKVDFDIFNDQSLDHLYDEAESAFQEARRLQQQETGGIYFADG